MYVQDCTGISHVYVSCEIQCQVDVYVYIYIHLENNKNWPV